MKNGGDDETEIRTAGEITLHGGHLMAGHEVEVKKAVMDFVQRYRLDESR